MGNIVVSKSSEDQWANIMLKEAYSIQEIDRMLNKIKNDNLLQDKIRRKRNWKKPRSKFKSGWGK